MKLPSRMLDLSVPLDNETVLDPPIMRLGSFIVSSLARSGDSIRWL